MGPPFVARNQNFYPFSANHLPASVSFTRGSNRENLKPQPIAGSISIGFEANEATVIRVFHPRHIFPDCVFPDCVNNVMLTASSPLASLHRECKPIVLNANETYH